MFKGGSNEPLSGLTHLVGFWLSIAALVVLVAYAVMFGTTWHVVGFSIFGASLILLYAASTAYHFASKTHPAKSLLQKIDHAFIYVLIAGTYTPICLVALHGGWGWAIFGVTWALAVLGIILKLTTYVLRGWVSVLYYILLGWLAVIAVVPLSEVLPFAALRWLFMGGVAYTIGTIFYALDHVVPRTRWFGMHEIFHVFVLAGSFSHFWMMFRYLV